MSRGSGFWCRSTGVPVLAALVLASAACRHAFYRSSTATPVQFSTDSRDCLGRAIPRTETLGLDVGRQVYAACMTSRGYERVVALRGSPPTSTVGCEEDEIGELFRIADAQDSQRRTYRPRVAKSAVLRLRRGMTSAEVLTLFGPPDTTSEQTCGREAPFPCQVWAYNDDLSGLTQQDLQAMMTLGLENFRGAFTALIVIFDDDPRGLAVTGWRSRQ